LTVPPTVALPARQPQQRWRAAFPWRSLAVCAAAGLLLACSSSTKTNVAGSNRSQLLLVSADSVNKASLQYYGQQNADARKKGELITAGAEFNRVNAIMRRMVPQVGAFRDDAMRWAWELVLIDEPTVNAHVMAGGKITFYTGLIRKLNLSDDEIAAVMGHEIAHALREHTREKMSQQQAANLLLSVGGAVAGAGSGTMQMAGLAKNIALDLPFSRNMESEADEYGLELSARAGYNPQAAISLWDKMGQLGGNSSPGFLSTHPAPGNRKATLTALQPKVQPLYEAARKSQR
jgi:predicted Zn-dependent protease